MTSRKTVSKLRSGSAPYLAQAPAPKLGVGIDLNRDRHRVSSLLGPDTVLTRSRYRAYSVPIPCLLGPDTVLTRSRPHRGPDAVSLRGGPYLDDTARQSHPLHAPLRRHDRRKGTMERNRQRDDRGVAVRRKSPRQCETSSVGLVADSVGGAHPTGLVAIGLRGYSAQQPCNMTSHATDVRPVRRIGPAGEAVQPAAVQRLTVRSLHQKH